MGKYDDIINLPHHVSLKHPHMPVADRAAQFAPFAALTGYEAAVKETARTTEKRADLDENQRALLDTRMALLESFLSQNPQVTVTYMIEDSRKSGGKYVNYTGVIKEIDRQFMKLEFEDGTQVAFDDIIKIDCELFYKLGDMLI